MDEWTVVSCDCCCTKIKISVCVDVMCGGVVGNCWQIFAPSDRNQDNDK